MWDEIERTATLDLPQHEPRAGKVGDARSTSPRRYHSNKGCSRRSKRMSKFLQVQKRKLDEGCVAGGDIRISHGQQVA